MFESQFARRYCQIFSTGQIFLTGLSSGYFNGSRMIVRFFGRFNFPVVCHPALSAQMVTHQQGKKRADNNIPFLVAQIRYCRHKLLVGSL